MFSDDPEEAKKNDLILVPSKANLDQDSTVETSFKDDDDFDVFQPTNEWKTIEKGQSIPRGLHVQIDLQTGEKKAKLMDGNSAENENKQSVKTETKQNYIKIDKDYISRQKLKDVLKDFKDKFHDENFEGDAISAHGGGYQLSQEAWA